MKICTKCKQPTENIREKCSWCRPCCAAHERAKLADPVYRAKKKARRKEPMKDPEYRKRFYAHAREVGKRNYKFQEKMRRAHSKHRYGIVWEERQWLYNLASFCWLCRNPFIERPFNGDRRIDHDHTCHNEKQMCKKCIRGVLCEICNRHVLPYLERIPHLQTEYLKTYLTLRPFSENGHKSVMSFLSDFGIGQGNILHSGTDTCVPDSALNISKINPSANQMVANAVF